MKKALMKEYAKMFTEKVAVIHSAFDEKPTTVAFVEVAKELSDEEKCEVAFKKTNTIDKAWWTNEGCLLYTSPSPRDVEESRMPSSA